MLIPGYPLPRRTGLLYVHCPLKADVGEIAVTIKTGPVDADDASYMCSTNGMLQWHAQIKYGVEAAAAAEKTPAVMAAHANDYVAYSTSEFKQLLTAYVNDEVRCCQDHLQNAVQCLEPLVGRAGRYSWFVRVSKQVFKQTKASRYRRL